jgi:hypothetical protein
MADQPLTSHTDPLPPLKSSIVVDAWQDVLARKTGQIWPNPGSSQSGARQ